MDMSILEYPPNRPINEKGDGSYFGDKGMKNWKD